MTKNQIEYLRVQDQMRKNRQDASLALQQHQENKRHNFVTEFEANRANVAREGEESRRTAINAQSLSETMRANREKERQNQLVINETNRSNLVREGEAHRANLAQEAIQSFNANINARNAAANVMNANTNALNAETNEYNAVANVNNLLSQNQQRQAQTDLIKQQQLESEARTKYYDIQADLSIPGRTLADVSKALKTSMELATLFAK